MTRLPPESDLCRSFSLARSTVRESLRLLERRGRIKLVPRRGAYASPLLLISSVSWNKNKLVFDYYLSWVRSDVVKITVEAQAYLDLRAGNKLEGTLRDRGMNN